MAPLSRIIIDTDPGIDDVFAILLALSARAEELEVVLISVTFGNVEVRSCLRNVVAIFQVLEKELQWRRENGKAEGFEGMTKHKPIVAVGANEPLHEQLLMADYFHGTDGLAGIHESHPHLSPKDTWQKLFERPPPDTVISEIVDDEELAAEQSSFRPSLLPAHKEILRVLRENEADTITIVAIGPLTNLALAAAEDTETFLRVKEVVTMGGAIDMCGNVTPVAEFNVFADSVAAARIYALTSASPSSTMPPNPPHVDPSSILPPYPTTLSHHLKLTLFSLDITELHTLTRGLFNTLTQTLIQSPTPSPLATWLTAFMHRLFAKIESLHHTSTKPSSQLGSDNNHSSSNETAASLSLHDPLCIYYILTHSSSQWTRSPQSPEDIRVDTTGQWTRGMTLVDRRRSRRRRDSEGVRSYDLGDWLGRKSGNRVARMVGSPRQGEEEFGREMLERILGLK